MGFWNALSVLAPVAPALSDAQDIRTQRTQDAAKFTQEQQLKQAQITAQQMAAQADQQRIIKESTVRDLGWSPTAQSDQVLIQDPKTGAFRAQNTPGGINPSQRYKQTVDEFKSVAKRDPTPDENQQFLMQAYGIPGSALGRSSAKPVTLKGPGGDPIGASFLNGRYYDADGKEIADPVLWEKPAAPHPVSPSSQYTNLLAKQILANKKQGPPLTNEEVAQLQASQSALTVAGIARAQAFAQAAAANNLVAITDPATDMDTLVTRQQAVNMVNSGAPPLAGVVSAPTGLDKKNSTLAQSAIQQVNRMQAILRTDPKLTGPGNGQLTRLQTLLGTQDPDAQQFLISSLLGSEHGVAVFGGRNIHTIQDLNDALGSMKTNPAALSAALDVVKETMALWVTAGVRLPGPGPRATGGGAGGGTGQFVVIDPNNKPHRFDTQAQADNFRGLIKPK